LINNRQGGRRRGRGGGPLSPNSGPNPGNRQDNRSRGNAAQLLEKYKSLARDAQMQGDRVQSEYFLQFAEHYFRVLNESRARFEEQRPRRDDYYSDEDEDQDEAASAADEGDEREPMEERDERPFRAVPERADRDRNDRGDRNERDRNERGERNERPRRDFRAERNGEPRPERRPREDREERPRREVNGSAPQPESERIALDVLPPAISPTISVVEGDGEPKPVRRRTRRPRTDEGDTEIAPAA
jgi:hypothetical protein